MSRLGGLIVGLAADLVVDRQPGRTQWAEDFVQDAADGIGGAIAPLLDPPLRSIDLPLALVLDEVRHRHFVQRRGLFALDALPGDGRRAHFRWRLGGGEAGAGRLRRVEPGAC